MIVYRTENKITGKFYYGVHNNTRERYLGSGELLKKAIEKHGRDNFVRRTVMEFDTEALRTLAYSGGTVQLREELRCMYDTEYVNLLELPQSATSDPHPSDTENVGFAGELRIEDWVFSMYHPTQDYPDNFIVININTQEWFRYDHSREEIILQSN